TISQAAARPVDVGDPAGIRLRRGPQVRVATSRRHSPSRLGDLVRRLERRIMQAAVGGLPRERAAGEAELRGDVERAGRVGANHGLRGAVGAAGRAWADGAWRGPQLDVFERVGSGYHRERL